MTALNLQPTLRGTLLSLRPLVAEDFEALFAVSAAPKPWEQHPENLRYRRDVFERFFEAAIASKGALIAIDAKTGEAIGSSRYSKFNAEERTVEIGYTFLARKCWGRGFNREMKALMLRH